MEPSIDCHALFVRLGEDELLVIDCREQGAVEEAVQVPGALRMGFDELTECCHILPDDELIVVVGCAPDGSDSQQVSRLLRSRGRTAVCLEGGLPAWIAGGYPTEPYVSRSERVARKHAVQDSHASAASEG